MLSSIAINRGRAVTLCAVALLSAPISLATAQGPRGELNTDLAAQRREPFQIFDNLYFIGVEFVSSYLLTTNDGLIVIDALLPEEGYADYLLDNVSKLGFDPANIEYVLITHGHPDHYGSASQLQEQTGARIGAAEEDWKLIEQNLGPRAPRRDLVIEQDDTLILADTVIRFDITPGHTPGVISVEFDVYDAGRRHKAYLHGGSAVRTEEPAAIERFIADLDRIKRIEGIEVRLSNHPFVDDLFARAERLATRQPGEPHPFVAPGEFYRWIDQVIAETRSAFE